MMTLMMNLLQKQILKTSSFLNERFLMRLLYQINMCYNGDKEVMILTSIRLISKECRLIGLTARFNEKNTCRKRIKFITKINKIDLG